MTCAELQEEELEVLLSIFDGDTNFKQLSNTSFQYKIGEDDDPKSFLLEISWVEKYPELVPVLSLDAFYNKKLVPEVKKLILEHLLTEAKSQLGTPMTYTLIDWAKEHFEKLTEMQPDKPVFSEALQSEDKSSTSEELVSSAKKEKKTQLSKHQKRKLAERLDAKGERPRGWDWIDVVKHLSQTGQKQTDDDTAVS